MIVTIHNPQPTEIAVCDGPGCTKECPYPNCPECSSRLIEGPVGLIRVGCDWLLVELNSASNYTAKVFCSLECFTTWVGRL